MANETPGLDVTLGRIARAGYQRFVLDTARRLYDIERPFGFGAFEQSARFCRDTLAAAGAEDVELLEFPADGRSTHWDKRLPLAWYPESAKLEVVRPSGAFGDPVIADLSRSPFHLAMWSVSTPPGGIVTELVTENMVRAGHSAEGRLVLAEPYRFPKTIYRAVCDRGGIGIVSDFVKDPFATPDGLFWVNSFGESPEWFHGADNRDLLGFCVTPRVGRRLRELLVSRSVTVRAEVQARKEPGRLHVATGRIRGSELPDEEVWLAAHLFEPLGCDNSPGAASAMAVIKVLRDLVEAGELPRPRRSIRAVMSLELYGFTAALKQLTERGTRVAATFVLDGVTFRQEASGLPMELFLSPDANPLFSHEPIERAVDMCLKSRGEAWRAANPGATAADAPSFRYTRGYFGNDAFLGDPMAGGPSFHFHVPGGAYWHNSENDFSMVDPELLNATTALHAGLACYLASLGPDDAASLSQLVEEEGRRYVTDAYLEVLRGGESPEAFARAIRYRLDQVARRFRNLRGWTGARTDEAAERVKAEAEGLLDRAGVQSRGVEQRNLDEVDHTDRRAATVVFRRTEPTFPMSLAFVPDVADRRELSGGLDNVLARMDGERDLLSILDEEEYFSGRSLSRRRILSDCLLLAEHGYLDARFTASVTGDEILAGLRRVGVQEGDLVFAHSSMTAFGHVEGGAEAIVDALLRAVGPGGTVLVPTFTSCGLTALGSVGRSLRAEPFHPGLDRLWTGAVPRAFLAREGVHRSMHPTHSVAGIGPLAADCVGRQALSDPPMGETSALARLADLGARILYVGAPLHSTTFLHYLETKLRLPYLMKGVALVRGDDGRTDYVSFDGHVGGHRSFYSGDWRDTKVFRALLEAGLNVASTGVGLGEILQIDAAEFEQKGLSALRSDPGLLLCDSPDCLFCRRAHELCSGWTP